MDFGKLQFLELREVWKNEASDFTPWLAENIQSLGDALGLELEVKEREASVGAFSCDLHAVDLASGRTVIVENQLESTDHSHLGQLLTYAAGLEAAVVVWIAKEIRDEHRAALDWLNRKTTSGVDFFAVIPKVFRIDNSKPTYELNLVVAPNEWGKELVDSEKEIDQNSKSYRYRIFFQRLVDSARVNGFKGLKKALPQSWIRFSTPFIDIGLYVAFNRPDKIKVELYLESKDTELNKRRFDLLFSERDNIDKTTNNCLSWERLDERIGSRIAVYLTGSIDNQPEDLEISLKGIISNMLILRGKLYPFLQKVVDVTKNN